MNNFPRHEGITGEAKGSCQGSVTLLQMCSVQGRPQALGSSSSLPSAQTVLEHQPCPASALEMGASQGRLNFIQQQEPALLGPGCVHAAGQSRLRLLQPLQDLAKLSTNQCPEDAKPAWLLAPLGFSYFWCWWGGGKNVKQDFSSCPYVMPLLSFLLTFLSTDVALTAQCGHRYQPRTWLSCLFFLKREQQGQWGNGSCQGKERADLNFLHFSRARNS